MFLKLHMQSHSGLLFLIILWVLLSSCAGIMAPLWVFNVSWSRCKLTFRLHLHLSERHCALIIAVIISAAEYRCSGFLDNVIENHYNLTEGDART